MAAKIDPGDKEKLEEGTLVSHLVELRQRLVKAVAAILLVFLCLMPFARQVFEFVSRPLVAVLPEGSTMVAIGPVESFFATLKTTLFASLFIAMPVVLYQIWKFVAPGLYSKEQRFVFPLVISSILLFYVGVAFAYFVVFKLVFAFAVGYAPENVMNTPGMDQFVSFALRIFFAFGLAFEVPIATFMLVWSRLVTIESLGKARPYVFLGAFVAGMFLTPPDAISQTLLAVPIYILYESGLLMARFMLRDQIAEQRAEKEARQEEESGTDAED